MGGDPARAHRSAQSWKLELREGRVGTQVWGWRARWEQLARADTGGSPPSWLFLLSLSTAPPRKWPYRLMGLKERAELAPAGSLGHPGQLVGAPRPCYCPSAPVHLMFEKTFLGTCGKANLYGKHV